MTFEARSATTNWNLDTAAEEMINGHFRQLLVVDEKGYMVGIGLTNGSAEPGLLSYGTRATRKARLLSVRHGSHLER